ncbi:MAG: leucine-rich repeat domain-containing protein [Simkaniaceae bacterium]|nr:leucine-rich repeat domain-containing protein [Simkaniaceae bacterium]
MAAIEQNPVMKFSPELLQYTLKFCDPQITSRVSKLWAENTSAALTSVLKSIGRVMPESPQELEKIKEAYIRALKDYRHYYPVPKGGIFCRLPLISVERYKAIMATVERLKRAEDKVMFWRCLPGGVARINAIKRETPEIPDFVMVAGLNQWMQNNQAILTLEVLDLEKRNLQYLPEEIGNLTALKALKLNENQLKELPVTIGDLTELVVLVLGNNQLKELPKTIGNLIALQTLDLNFNQLKELPIEIGNLTALQRLGLNSNQLKELPVEIGNLIALQTLCLGSNQIQALPAAIGNLRALKFLDLINNQLKSLPDTIGNLIALEALTLTRNFLEELPDTIGNLTSLQELSLNQNQLEEFPESIGNLLALQTLNLSCHLLFKLSEATGGFIWNLTTLQIFDPQTNELLTVPREDLKAAIDQTDFAD